jgi:YD repeat-containing protein
MSTIPCGLSVVARLLDGTKDEVTNVVRRQVYNALGRLVRHHTLGSDDELERATELISGSIIDKDRSVRISAG